jgi:hypothetical protein
VSILVDEGLCGVVVLCETNLFWRVVEKIEWGLEVLCAFGVATIPRVVPEIVQKSLMLVVFYNLQGT